MVLPPEGPRGNATAMMRPAGVQTGFAPKGSASLEARQEALLRWHVENQQKAVERIESAPIYGFAGAARAGKQKGLSGCWSAEHVAHGPGMGITDWSGARKAPSALGPTGPASSKEPGPDDGGAPEGRANSKDSPSRRLTKLGLGTAAEGEVEEIELDLVLDGLRRRMARRGLDAVLRLKAFFRAVDTDSSGSLSYEEFQKAMIDYGVLKSDLEARIIFSHFDKNESGNIEWNEFMTVVKGNLPNRRRKIVHEAFDMLDVDKSGVLDIDDMKKIYRTFAHPDVVAGVRTEEEVFGDFLAGFDTMRQDGRISLSEFELYYEHLSTLIDKDEFFEAMVRNTWHMKGAQGGHCLRLHITLGGAWTSSGRTGAQGVETKQETVEIRPDIGVNRHDPGFFDLCRERLKELGHDDVLNIEVLGRY